MNRQIGIHPRIGQLVIEMERLKGLLYQANYEKALSGMYLCMLGLKPEDKDADQVSRVSREVTMLGRFDSNSQRRDRLKRMGRTYRLWFADLSDLLWNKGYYTNAKYGIELKEDDVKFG